MMDYVNTGGINVILTPGRYNAAFFEHSYLAEKTYSILAMPSDLYVENDVLYYKDYSERPKRVGAVYHRISDEYMDPLTFNPESVIGVPGIMSVYKAGNVALVNAPGNGIGDDKGIYYFVPKMIEYYLHETPLLKNAPTYLPYFEEDRKYVLEIWKGLSLKMWRKRALRRYFRKDLNGEKLEEMRRLISRESRRFIAQEVIDFKDLEIVEGGGTVERKADLRAFVLYGKEVKVWKSGLTRFSRNPDSFVVNSSQGGGFKDTWVLSR